MKLQVVKYDFVDSTNNIAIRRIKNGKIKPTLILANSQKKGRGQYGRKWISYRGNVFITIYFKLQKKITIKTLSKKVYSTIKTSLEKLINEKITIKLPNDLLIKGSKICGILQETVNYNNKKYFIIGIGINLIKSPKIPNKQVSFLQKYNNNKIKKTDIYKNIKNNFEKFI